MPKVGKGFQSTFIRHNLTNRFCRRPSLQNTKKSIGALCFLSMGFEKIFSFSQGRKKPPFQEGAFAQLKVMSFRARR